MTGVSAPVQLDRPPEAVLWVAGAGLVMSVACLVPWSLVPSIVGYLLAPIVVTGLVTLFRYRDALASQSPYYAAQRSQMRLATALVLVSFLIGLAHAWVIATEVAKWFAG